MSAEYLLKAQWLSSDIISTLPETIIETILCLVPIKEAARTSILSRDWRYKWSKIPKLEFNCLILSNKTSKKKQSSNMRSSRKNMDERYKLFYAIQQVLLLRQGPIHEFTLYMGSSRHNSEVDQIILHLSRNHSIKKLTLGFGDDHYFYKLPMCAFSLHQLTDLTLEFVNLDHQPIFNGFRSLRSLCLKGVVINTKSILHLLSNCPSLTKLSLLDDVGHIGHKDCTIMELFECLSMIEHLTISREVIHKLLVLDSVPEEIPTSLIHLKYFCFQRTCFADDHGLLFLAILLKYSPNMEKITLKGYDTLCRCFKDEISSDILAKCSNVRLEHLNELEIDCFLNCKPKMEFVKFILARSLKLKKVNIYNVVYTYKEQVEMLTILLRAPRASLVEIVVDSVYKCSENNNENDNEHPQGTREFVLRFMMIILSFCIAICYCVFSFSPVDEVHLAAT